MRGGGRIRRGWFLGHQLLHHPIGTTTFPEGGLILRRIRLITPCWADNTHPSSHSRPHPSLTPKKKPPTPDPLPTTPAPTPPLCREHHQDLLAPIRQIPSTWASRTDNMRSECSNSEPHCKRCTATHQCETLPRCRHPGPPHPSACH